MELTEEAKAAIAKEFEELSRKNNETLQELNIYKWALRLIFVLIFGGTIVGVLKLQDYLDDRIQKRNEELSGIIYGSVAQNSNDASTAIDQYYAFLDKLENPILRPSDQVRAIYFLRFIQALADANATDPTGEFESKSVYFALLDSKYFKKDEHSNKQRWLADPNYLNPWGRCLVKFGATPKEVESAKDYFQQATMIAQKPSNIAENHFALAMLSLAKGDEDPARQNFQKAMKISPKSHGPKEFTGAYVNDLENEYQIWRRAAKVFNNPNIDSRYERVMKSLIAKATNVASK